MVAANTAVTAPTVATREPAAGDAEKSPFSRATM